MATDPYKHQKKYAKKQQKRDMVRVSVWVPAQYKYEVLAHADELRKRR